MTPPSSRPDEAPSGIRTPGLGDTQRRLLEALKRGAPLTLVDLEDEFGLSVETLREHLNSLAARDLVRRAGKRRRGPGRPRILYDLTEEGEALFPQREGELLRMLAGWLLEHDREELLADFFDDRLESVRRAALDRVRGLRGRERLEAVAALLTEQGFMAEAEDGGDGGLRLRLCHCPLKEIVAVSDLPCRAELAWVEEALGADLEREEYMPDGDHACTYVLPADG